MEKKIQMEKKMENEMEAGIKYTVCEQEKVQTTCRHHRAISQSSQVRIHDHHYPGNLIIQWPQKGPRECWNQLLGICHN